jgi:hypothetical protein
MALAHRVLGVFLDFPGRRRGWKLVVAGSVGELTTKATVKK